MYSPEVFVLSAETENQTLNKECIFFYALKQPGMCSSSEPLSQNLISFAGRELTQMIIEQFCDNPEPNEKLIVCKINQVCQLDINLTAFYYLD